MRFSVYVLRVLKSHVIRRHLSQCVSVKEVFRLQNDMELVEAENKYLPPEKP
jgi:hypothetical protein